MKAYNKKQLYILKATIKGFTAEARKIQKSEILPKSKEERQQGRNRKNLLGLHARFHLLAYALMLGRRYDELEKNKPLFTNRYQTKTAAEEILNVCKLYGDYRIKWSKELTVDAITLWLATGENHIFIWDDTQKKNSQPTKASL